MRHARFICLAGAIGIGLATGSRPAPLEPVTARPEARAQTAPVPHGGDAADDPAVWIHPRDPGLSLVLGTDKQGGLHSYNMDGSEQQVVADAPRPNNVDVLYGFKLEGRTVDLAVASLQASKQRGTRGVKVWAIDAATRRLSDVTQGGSIRVLGGKKPYGLCGYRSARSGRFYVFVTDERGRVEQDELTDAGGGRIAGAAVREPLRPHNRSEGSPHRRRERYGRHRSHQLRDVAAFRAGRVHRAGWRERRRQPEFQALRVGRHRRSESADRCDVPSQTSGLGGSRVIGATQRERSSMPQRCHASVVAGPRAAGSLRRRARARPLRLATSSLLRRW